MIMYAAKHSLVAALVLGFVSVGYSQTAPQSPFSDIANTTTTLTKPPTYSPPFANVVQPNAPSQPSAPPFANTVQPNAPTAQPPAATVDAELPPLQPTILESDVEVEATAESVRRTEPSSRGPQSLIISSQTGTTGTIRISDPGKATTRQDQSAPAARAGIKYSEEDAPAADRQKKREMR